MDNEKGRNKKKMAAGHLRLVEEQYCESRKKKDGHGSVSWDHPSSNVPQRYAELKKIQHRF